MIRLRDGCVVDTACFCRAHKWEVEHSWMQLDASCSFRFDADVGTNKRLGSLTEHLLEICDVVLRCWQ
jgi:hypothetical protein